VDSEETSNDGGRYERIVEARHWVGATLLQIERFVEALLAFAEAEVKTNASLVSVDGHFLLNAGAQAEKALQRAGFDVPPRQRTTIRSLRDVHEHWEQHKASFESERAAKTRSGLRFSQAHPGQIPWNFRFDGTGTYISALRLEDLWEELGSLDAALLEELEALAKGTGSRECAPSRHGEPFPRRASRVVGMSMVTQNIVLSFDDP
jgi:hypothetical protein